MYVFICNVISTPKIMSISIIPYSSVPSLLLIHTKPLCPRQSLVLFLLSLAIDNVYIHTHMNFLEFYMDGLT